jgi:hypothetical protein
MYKRWAEGSGGHPTQSWPLQPIDLAALQK